MIQKNELLGAVIIIFIISLSFFTVAGSLPVVNQCSQSHTSFVISEVVFHNYNTSSQKLYPVEFEEQGLPNDTQWSVSLNSTNQTSATNTITFLKANGTYVYQVGLVRGFTVTPFAGLLKVTGGSNTTLITFSKLYSIDFYERGLPAGTTWSIAFDGIIKPTALNQIRISVVNGSYPYTINVPENYTASPSFGTVNISGSSYLLNISFNLYSITFTGLLTPNNATMTIDGKYVSTVGGVFTVTLLAGQKYEIMVTAPGYKNYVHNLTVTTRTYPSVLLNVNLMPLKQKIFPIVTLITDLIIIAAVLVVVVLILRATFRKNRGQS